MLFHLLYPGDQSTDIVYGILNYLNVRKGEKCDNTHLFAYISKRNCKLKPRTTKNDYQ